MRKTASSLEKMVRKITFAETSPVPALGGCWLWCGALTDDGYAKVRRPGRTKYGHRLMYEDVVGPVPEGLVLDHLCRVRNCVNPSHLEPVTSRVNTLRGETLAARELEQTHCIKGHPFDEGNTRLGKGRRMRICRACAQRTSSERKALAKEGLIPIKRHGTTTGYDYGCRCADCRAAHASYRRDYLRRKAGAA